MPISNVPSTLKILDIRGKSSDVFFLEGGRLDFFFFLSEANYNIAAYFNMINYRM